MALKVHIYVNKLCMFNHRLGIIQVKLNCGRVKVKLTSNCNLDKYFVCTITIQNNRIKHNKIQYGVLDNNLLSISRGHFWKISVQLLFIFGTIEYFRC